MFNKQTPKPKAELIAALDLGANKICCAIAKAGMSQNIDGSLSSVRILGVGYQLSKGLKGGSIVDMEALEDSILNAVHGAEQAAGKNINSVYVSLPGRWVESHSVRAELSLSPNTPIDENHIRRLLTINKDLNMDPLKKVLHVIPISYQIDNIKGILDPKGMIGGKLAVDMHVITAPSVMIQNFASCIAKCHLDVAAFIASPYASGLSTLVPDEMTLGATVIDLGAGQTTLASFREGNLTSLSSIPIGGSNITNDIARGLNAPIAQAERLKTLYGTLIPSSIDDKENILISQLGETLQNQTHHIPKGVLVHIIKARVEEIFEHIARKVQNKEIDPLAFHAIVLTGGVSQLQGVREMAQGYFKKTVRVATPSQISGTIDLIHSPSFSTCAGLLLYAHQDLESQQAIHFESGKPSIWKKINQWTKQNF